MIVLAAAGVLALMTLTPAQTSSTPLAKICASLGQLTPSSWTEQQALADAKAIACPIPPKPVSTALPSGPRVTALKHAGNFELPAEFAYGGQGLAYNKTRNSLIVSGFNRSPLTAEVSIPRSGTAKFLQPLVDSTEGKSPEVNLSSPNDKKVGGYYILGSRLIISVFDYYDGAGTQMLSHFVRPLDLNAKDQVEGPCRVGPLGAGLYSGYFADIPAEWQVALGGPVLIGNGGLSIIGRTSHGPAAFAIDPAKVCVNQNAVPLLYYPRDHPMLGDYGLAGIHPMFNGTSRITGVVFPPGTSSVLFFGRTGFGPFCYGEASACGNDPGERYKGVHASPYGYFVWAYDAADFAAVKAGKKQPWDVVPYATWEPLARDGGWDQILGAAFDPATGRIFVESQANDNLPPTIHIFTVGQ